MLECDYIVKQIDKKVFQRGRRGRTKNSKDRKRLNW